jgi:hypothetical protein
VLSGLRLTAFVGPVRRLLQGLMSLDPLELEIKRRVGTAKEKAMAAKVRVFPFLSDARCPNRPVRSAGLM